MHFYKEITSEPQDNFWIAQAEVWDALFLLNRTAEILIGSQTDTPKA